MSKRDNEIGELKSLLDENSVQEKFREMQQKLNLTEAKNEEKILAEEISNKNDLIKEFEEKSSMDLKEMNAKIEQSKINNEMLQQYIIYH